MKYATGVLMTCRSKRHGRPSTKSEPMHGNKLTSSFLSSKATSIVHAGDPDDEGCLLVDEILDYAKNTKPVQRLLVADLNLAPVQKALANMQPNEIQGHDK
ncbi:hypothetical protein [Escherichia coli]|uniref:hypothetical protein n=1 Tax=Escherichia coli TaxID=562 RepID=UPI00388F119D